MCLPDDECHCICLPDAERQGICLPDQSVNVYVYQTQSIKVYVYQTQTRSVRAFAFVALLYLPSSGQRMSVHMPLPTQRGRAYAY
jgi:uncharacterized protein YaeQ